MNPATLRGQAQKLKNDGNFNDAYKILRRLCLDANAGAMSVGKDLASAVECLQRLGRIQEFDELVEQTIGVHKQNWRLLQAAAQQYLSVEHHGGDRRWCSGRNANARDGDGKVCDGGARSTNGRCNAGSSGAAFFGKRGRAEHGLGRDHSSEVRGQRLILLSPKWELAARTHRLL